MQHHYKYFYTKYSIKYFHIYNTHVHINKFICSSSKITSQTNGWSKWSKSNMLSNGNAGLVQLNMSNVNGAAKNKLHEKWDTVKRKLGPLVKKSTSSPGKYFKSSQNYLVNIIKTVNVK